MNYQPQGTYHDHSTGSEKSKPLRQIPFGPNLCIDLLPTGICRSTSFPHLSLCLHIIPKRLFLFFRLDDTFNFKEARMFTGLEVISCVHPSPLLHHFPASYKILIHFAPGKSFYFLFSGFYPYWAFYFFLDFRIFPLSFRFIISFFFFFSLFFIILYIFSLFSRLFDSSSQRFAKGNKNGVGCS